MDNFEQVLDAAGEVGQLLTMTERVRVLATTREPLGLTGEQEYPVPPLGLPDPEHLPPPDRLSRYEAVALFIERARAVNPRFAVTNENAAAVAEICGRLDGLPLALELAAARVKILTPQAMLSRLENRLQFLARASRDAPTRQQTLRDAIDWSYDLLEGDEPKLFARLSVFVDGFSLEGAEAVCNPGGELAIDTLDGVASLTNKSLLRQSETLPGEPRFLMLETIREYAGERLAQEPDPDEISQRHAAFFLDLAERAEPELTGQAQQRWLDVLSAEHDNLRAALVWAQGSGDVETALRLAAALWRFWQMRGHLREGRERLSSVLELPEAADHPEAQARALEAAGSVWYWMADFQSARRFYERSLEIHRRLGNARGAAEQLYNMNFTYSLPPPPLNDLTRAQRLLEESLALFREVGDEQGVAKVLWGLGNVRLVHGDAQGALAISQESLEMARKLGDRYGQTWSLWLVGASALESGRLPLARKSLREALGMLSAAGDTSGMPIMLSELSGVALESGDPRHAVRLQAAAEAVEDSIGTGLGRATSRREARAESVRKLIAQEDLADAWAEGEAMSVDEAVAYALELEPGDGQASAP
jgi:predicted ATPase